MTRTRATAASPPGATTTRMPARLPAHGDPPRLVIGRRSNRWVRRALVFAICVLVLDALVGDSGMTATVRARQDAATVAAGLLRVRQENARLLEQVRRLQDDPAAVEAVARKELGLIKPGEILFVVRELD